MANSQSYTHRSFVSWCLQEPENKRMYLFSLVGIIVQFFLFKLSYRFPNFIPSDSNYYIEAAIKNQDINFWAIGYSKFLRAVGFFTHSHQALVWTQYLLLQASILYLIYTIRYFYNITPTFFRILLAISLLNPLVYHISNFVSSDPLFTMLSIAWFAHLIWLLHRPTLSLIIGHTLLLFCALMVRHNALYYPLISMGILLFTYLSFRRTLMAMVLIAIGPLVAVGHAQYFYYRQTNTVQYSAFGGWQLAANALYGYARVIPDTSQKAPYRLRELHALVNQHIDSLRHIHPRPDAEITLYYLWNEQAPLKKYMRIQYQKDSTTIVFTRWASMGPLYARYGKYLIRKYPGYYLRYFVWPNLIKYYAPPSKFMSIYNLGNTSVSPVVVQWFRLDSNKVSTVFQSSRITISDYLTILFAVLNVVFLSGLFSLLYLHGSNGLINKNNSLLFITTIVWLINMVFSVLSAPIELRYQLLPFILLFIQVSIMLNQIITIMRQQSFTSKVQDSQPAHAP